MSDVKKTKYSNTDLIRERYSSFVVDLRTTAESIKTNQNDNTRSSIPKFKSQIDVKQPRFKWDWSYLKIKSSKKHTNTGFLINNKRKKIFFLPKFSLSSKLYFFKNLKVDFLQKHSRKKRLWQEAIKKQQDIFNANFKFNNNRKKIDNIKTQITWYRSILSFLIVLLFLVIPLKLLSSFQLFDFHSFEARIMQQSKAAISQMMSGVESAAVLDFSQADANFTQASSGFLAAKKDLDLISDSLLYFTSISRDPKMKLAAESKKILSAGAASASLGKNLVLATDKLFSSDVTNNFSQSLNDFSYYGKLAVNDANMLVDIINSIKSQNLPSEYQAQFIELSSQVHKLSANLEDFIITIDKMQELLGLSRDKRYLLIFQNNSELRASGGFLGSYALLDVKDGKIKNLEVPAGGSYDTEGGMTVRVKAPEPLWLVNPSWHFWDANWWPDFTTTAKNLMWFYDKSGGPTVDGVVSLTPTVVEKLLEITGPIDMTAEYGLVITSENFWETVQKVVENQNLVKSHPADVVDFAASNTKIEVSIPLEQDLLNNVDNKPKKIIGDLMAKILETLPLSLNKDNLVKMATLIETSVAEKQILVFFTDPEIQAEVSKHGWSGEIKDSPHDYLLVVNTNIAGQKTDRKMIEKIEHYSRVDISGRIVNTVKISRTHTGIKNEALTGVRNVNWLRVYVPEGSRLLAASGLSSPESHYFNKPEEDWLDSDFLQAERLAVIDQKSGFKIYREAGKTVFAGWVMVDPGQSADIIISYELPFNFYTTKINHNWWSQLNRLINPELKHSLQYSLLVQKQPGAQPSSFISYLELPQNYITISKHPADMRINNGWQINDSLDQDKFFSILLNNQ